MLFRSPVDRRVSGVNFGRWLCKTHCNYMVANGLEPDRDYIRYAFVRPVSKPIYFQLDAACGVSLKLASSEEPPITWAQYLTDDQSFDGFKISLAGFPSFGSKVPINRNGQLMLDRISALVFPTPLGPFRIFFDWAGEPQGARAPEGESQKS